VSRAGITIYLRERLGNQLFMYATGLAQARRLGCPLYGNLASFHRASSRRYVTEYGLGCFDNGMVVSPDWGSHPRLYFADPGAWYDRPLLPPAKPRLWAGRMWESRVRPRLGDGVGPLVVERSFLYDPAISSVNPPATLLGYFQSWRYFDDIADELRRRLTTLLDPSPWFQETSAMVAAEPGSVVLNVRRGDYKSPEVRGSHGLASAAYYARGLDLVRRLGAEGPVYVVSDEIDVAMSELAGLGDLCAIDPPPGTDHLETILAMSRAGAIVMANSTFSWWAAWIGDRPGRPVVAPRPFFNALGKSARDLLMPHWIALESRDLTEM
jgi:hypothetical protein